MKFEKFTNKAIDFALKYVDVDYYNEAIESANKYNDIMSMSKSALIDQLIFEGFSTKQAKYGVKNMDK